MGDYLTNHPHYIQGVEAERERIIALLEDEMKAMSHPISYYDNPFGFAIALIKGENK